MGVGKERGGFKKKGVARIPCFFNSLGYNSKVAIP